MPICELFTVRTNPLDIVIRFGFQREGESTTTFILNLALVDFLNCILALPAIPVHFFSRGWHFGRVSCAAAAMIRWFLCYADWLSLALISLSRYNLKRKLILGVLP